jgi:hypothetical protein
VASFAPALLLAALLAGRGAAHPADEPPDSAFESDEDEAAAPAGEAPHFAQISDLDERVQDRTFPSIFQAWGSAAGPDEALEKVAKHDLVIASPDQLGLRWAKTKVRRRSGRAALTPESFEAARTAREDLLEMNPGLVLLVSLRADPRNPRRSADRCFTVLDAEVADGCFFDAWSDDDAGDALLEAVRQEIGLEPLIAVDAGVSRLSDRARKLVNGVLLRPVRSTRWSQSASLLEWSQRELLSPQLVLYDARAPAPGDRESPEALRKMRFATTLALIHSDGYVLFGDPPAEDGRTEKARRGNGHDFYPFWNKSLGRPVPAGGDPVCEGAEYQRDFEGGTAVNNPSRDPITVVCPEPRRSAAHPKAKAKDSWEIGPDDGDLLLR